MRDTRSHWVYWISLLICVPPLAHGQQAVSAAAPQSDPRAVQAISSALSAMGTEIPIDSSASGSVVVVEGGATKSGTIEILTKGQTDSLEQLTLGNTTSKSLYTSNSVNDSAHASAHLPYPLELAATAQSALFPFPLLTAIHSSPDTAYQYIGEELLEGTPCRHIRIWNTYASQPDLQSLSLYTYRDIWFSSSTSLPVQIAYTSTDGSGDFPKISVVVSFSNYQIKNGIQYPFTISKSINGIPWMTITITNVAFATGLSSSTFSIE